MLCTTKALLFILIRLVQLSCVTVSEEIFLFALQHPWNFLEMLIMTFLFFLKWEMGDACQRCFRNSIWRLKKRKLFELSCCKVVQKRIVFQLDSSAWRIFFNPSTLCQSQLVLYQFVRAAREVYRRLWYLLDAAFWLITLISLLYSFSTHTQPVHSHNV